MPPHRTAVHVITGATGSGKTRLVRSLLEHRSAKERWAVVTNDFGVSAIGDDLGRMENVTVHEVTGCACCTGHVVMRTALVRVLRDSAPDRVLIEASSAAEPGALSRLFAEPALSTAIDVRSLVATAAVSQLVNARYVNTPVYVDQLKSADVVVLTAPSGVASEELAAAKAALAQLVGAHAHVLESVRNMKLETLDK